MQTKYTLLTVCWAFLSLTLCAQTGSVSGTIVDAGDEVGLPGASVYLQGQPSLGTVTELDGSYTLLNVPVGQQVVVVSFVGFATQEIAVNVVEGEQVEVSAIMGGAVVLGQEILVTAQLLGQAKSINQQLNSDAIANFVSADKIKELPDVNAAEAISRLPGVAINRSGGEGSKIVVRGLDPKYTAITINGVRLPSTSGTDRSVDLSLISPELLSGIELFKSPTPDMDGDALGGTVNLNILRADDRPRGSLKAIGGYNDLSGEFKDYKFTGSFSRRIFNDKLGVIGTANTERFNRGGQTIRQSWRDNRKVLLDPVNNIFEQEGRALTYERRQEIRKRQNASLGLDYAFGKSTDVTLLGIYSRTSRDRFDQTELYNTAELRTSFTPGIIESSIDLYSGSFSARHELNWLRVEWGASYSQVVGQTPLDFEMLFFGEGQNFEPNSNQQLDDPLRFYDFLTVTPDFVYTQAASYRESSNDEDIKTAFLDLDLPFQVGDKISANFKFGGKFRQNVKTREFREFEDRQYYLRNNTIFNDFDPEGVGALGIDPTGRRYYGVQNFLTPGSVNVEDPGGSSDDLLFNFDEDRLRRFYDLYRDDFPGLFYDVTNNYNLDEKVTSGYAMFKFSVGDVLTVIPGFRYEQSNNTYEGVYADLAGDRGEFGTQTDTTVDRSYGNFLPHLHVKYKPAEWFDLRLSYSTTLARPDYNYVVPSRLINRSGELNIAAGNPFLDPTVSTNYDIYATAYSGKFGLVSVGAFYKDLKDAFYPYTLGVNNDTIALEYGLPAEGYINAQLATFASSPQSEVYGLEFDLQSSLSFLPKPFNGLVLNLNYTRLYSSTTVNTVREEEYFERVAGRPIRRTRFIPFEREAALVGQAKDIFNTSLGYDLGGLSARVSASYQGSKISGYSATAADDRYDRDFWRMDAAVKYRFSRRFNIFLNLNNLTNQQDVDFFRTERLETSRALYGTTATVGAEYKFIPKDN